MLNQVTKKVHVVGNEIQFDERFTLRVNAPPNIPRYKDVVADFFYDPMCKESLLESARIPGIDHPSVTLPETRSSMPPTHAHKVYGYVCDMKELQISESQEAVVETAMARRLRCVEAVDRTAATRHSMCQESAHVVESADEVQRSTVQDAVDAAEDKRSYAGPPQGDIGSTSQGMPEPETCQNGCSAFEASRCIEELMEEQPTKTSRRGSSEIPASSEPRRKGAARSVHPSLQQADDVMTVLYPSEDSVMLSSYETVSNRVCKIGTTRSFFGMHSVQSLVHQYCTMPLVFGSTDVLALPSSPQLNLVELDPQSVRSVHLQEALASPESANWIRAMEAEYNQLHDLQCWEPVYLPVDDPVNVVETKWLLKKKYKNGVFDSYKARLVVKGYTQVHGLDYFDTYAPVAAAVTLRLFLLLVALYALLVEQLDVRGAFLQADVDELLYMWPPECFTPKQPEDGTKLLYRLRKAWYGLRQAPRQWNKKLHQFLISYGLVQGQAD